MGKMATWLGGTKIFGRHQEAKKKRERKRVRKKRKEEKRKRKKGEKRRREKEGGKKKRKSGEEGEREKRGEWQVEGGETECRDYFEETREAEREIWCNQGKRAGRQKCESYRRQAEGRFRGRQACAR